MSSNGRQISSRAPRLAAPLRLEVVELLRRDMASAVYGPGERLVERDLCGRYQVSRSVIREALRHLEAEGLVVCVANQGPVVATITRDDARAIYEVRRALEALAGRLFAERATDRKIDELDAAFRAFKKNVDAGDVAGARRAKDHWYRVLFEGAANSEIGRAHV